MSRFSQDFYDHAVPKIRQDDYQGPRVSITFRALKTLSSSPRVPPPYATQSVSKPDPRQPYVRRAFTPPRKKVLILSDSKNRDFDCSQFPDPVAVFRKDLFYLRDLRQHSDAIEQADLVLISAGVNDLRKNNVDAHTLHNHVKSFVSKIYLAIVY